MEAQVDAFASKQQHHKKKYQSAIEREFKIKQSREQQATQAREKYESDCIRINSYTSQSMVARGQDLEKIHLKLERAQLAVQVNENDCIQSTRVLLETMPKWEQDWKGFCDTCQDLEEERMEFMKDNLWAYANAVSETCVSDDRVRVPRVISPARFLNLFFLRQSCERLRIALDHFQPKTDLEIFIQDYGTGSAIPEPPTFVNYTNTDAPPVSSTEVATRPANFVRSTQIVHRAAAAPEDDERYNDMNYDAAGSDGPSHGTSPSLSRSTTQKWTRSSSPADGVNGRVSPVQEPQIRHSNATAPTNPVSAGDPVDLTAFNSRLAIGDRVWDPDPHKDPQQQNTAQVWSSSPVVEQDPLVNQMEELSTATAASGDERQIRQDDLPLSAESRKGTDDSSTTASTTTSARAVRHDSGEVVASYPLALAPSLSDSSDPPKAVLAVPPPPSIPPSMSNIPVEQVVSGYQRPSPDEPRGQANSYVGPPPVVNQNPDQGGSCSASRGGYPGASTQSLVSRPSSAARGPGPTTAVQSYNAGPPVPSAPPSNGALHRGMSVSRQTMERTNPVGIPLRTDGRMVLDATVQQPLRQASAYVQPGHPLPPPPPPPPPPSRPHTYSAYHNSNRVLTHIQQPQPLPLRHDYAVMESNIHEGGHSDNYGHPPEPPDYHESNDSSYGSVMRPGHPQRGQTVGHATADARSQRHAHNTSVHRSMSLGIMRWSPSPPPPMPPVRQPPPTWTRSDNGREVLFYGACVASTSAIGLVADLCVYSEGAVRLHGDDQGRV